MQWVALNFVQSAFLSTDKAFDTHSTVCVK